MVRHYHAISPILGGNAPIPRPHQIGTYRSALSWSVSVKRGRVAVRPRDGLQPDHELFDYFSSFLWTFHTRN
jgi:hypothetical protein